MKKFIVISIGLLAIAVNGQKAWTLEECISYALQHNLTLKDANYQAQSRKETKQQAVRSLLPTVNGYADYTINYGRTIDPFTDAIIDTEFFSNNYSVNASLDIFRGFQKANTIKAAKFMHAANLSDVEQAKFQLAFQVMTAFYDILYFEGLLINNQQQVKISETNYNLVKKQLDLGLMAGADLYEAESSMLTDKLSVTQTENLLQGAKLTLIQAMNYGESTIKINPIQMHQPEVAQLATDSVYSLAQEFIPSIKAQKQRVKAAKKEVAIAKGALAPSIAFAAGYGTGYYETNTDSLGVIIPFRDQFRNNASRFVGASMNVPIGLNWSRRSAIKQRKIAHLRARTELELQQQQLYQTIQQLIQENRALSSEYQQSIKQNKAQEQTFEIQQKKYDKGLISLLELYQAQQLYAQAQNTNLQVRLRLALNSATLDFYQGLSVYNLNQEND